MAEPIWIGAPLTPELLVQVAREMAPVALTEAAKSRMHLAHEAIRRVAEGGDDAPRVYGVNTGFGFLAETRISASDVRQRSTNSTGV